jgi:hypothetical protein
VDAEQEVSEAQLAAISEDDSVAALADSSEQDIPKIENKSVSFAEEAAESQSPAPGESDVMHDE